MQKTVTEHRASAHAATSCATCHMPFVGDGVGRHRSHAFGASRSPAMIQRSLAVTAEINLHVPALLPATYVDDVHARLVLYKRLADCRTLEALEALREELIDRFGNLPEPARALIECHRLRVLGEPLGIARIDAAETAIQLQFVAKPPIEPAKVLKLVQQKKHYRLAGQDRLRIELKLPELRDRVSAVREAFGELA